MPVETILEDLLTALDNQIEAMQVQGQFDQSRLNLLRLRAELITTSGGGGGGGDASQTKQNQQIALETAIRDRLNAVDFADQTTLAAILAKLIAAPATEAKQEAVRDFLEETIAELIGDVSTNAHDLKTTLQGAILDAITQPISGTVGINNFPATQAITGTFATQTTLEALSTLIQSLLDRTPTQLLGDRTKVDSSPTALSSTHTYLTSNATTPQVIAANSSRRAATIFNASSSQVYARFATGTVSSTSYTFAINSNTGFNLTWPYSGPISLLWITANGGAHVTEYTI